ncbi:RICIN domain-containing protein [Cerasicoccus fimbriatus]|uniref:RICIN domain-containing protein n=1 Tax=Cerasicoccus fimbriatus TaxID=3014554 RepID=UPI0022B5AA70|nr:RICIN domain-containing protein [Cerasicoccus sp. TK19100]
MLLYLVFVASLITSNLHAEDTVQAIWPSYPYRVWYGADLKNKPELYPNLNVVTSGDAYDAHEAGKTNLAWIFGSNWKMDYGTGPDYWEQRFQLGRLTEKAEDGRPYAIRRAGLGMDEWTGTKHKEFYDWITEGTRLGKANQPDTFVAVWLSGGATQLYDMGYDGTIDLFLVQGYELTKDRGLGVPWTVAIERLEEFNQRGLMRKTLYSLGHVTDYANWKDDKVWNEAYLRERFEDLKRRYPDMPGISFFNAGAKNQRKYDELVQLVDRLSGEYWPALPLAEGLYTLVSQEDFQYRMEAANASETPGTTVQLGRSPYPAPAENQKWRFKSLNNGNYRIQPAYSDKLSLALDGNQVILAETDKVTEQVWRLEHTNQGYRVIPFNQQTLRLSFPNAEEGSPLTVVPPTNDESTIWAFNPEVSVLDPVPPYYQAEKATLNGNASESSSNPGSMGGYVSLHSPEDEIEFRNIDGGAGGPAVIGIRYANGQKDECTLQIEVNGTLESVDIPPTEDWRTWRTIRVPVNLRAGETNEVILHGPKEAKLSVDKITIYPAKG